MNSTVYAVDEYGNEAEDIRSGYVGEFKKFGFSGVPKHCLACDGSEISRATYSELFEVFGETYGAGDGETTFNLPDLRGAFLRCIGGNAAALGVLQNDAIRNIYGNVMLRAGADNAGIAVTVANGAFVKQEGVQTSAFFPTTVTSVPQTSALIVLDSSAYVPTAAENRPINYAVNVCVVYE